MVWSTCQVTHWARTLEQGRLGRTLPCLPFIFFSVLHILCFFFGNLANVFFMALRITCTVLSCSQRKLASISAETLLAPSSLLQSPHIQLLVGLGKLRTDEMFIWKHFIRWYRKTKSRIIPPCTRQNSTFSLLEQMRTQRWPLKQLKLEENHHFFPQVDLGISWVYCTIHLY